MVWKKGQSGNPGGRRRNQPSLSDALRAALNTTDEHGVSHRTAIALKILELARAGNLEAIKLAFERIDGKVIERIEQTGPDGGPFLLRVAVVNDRSEHETDAVGLLTEPG